MWIAIARKYFIEKLCIFPWGKILLREAAACGNFAFQVVIDM
jgi:hypothetical protein